MTRRKKIITWAIVIVVLVGGFLALRVSSWNQTYGLSEDIIAGETEPTAEETIRLYFYYSNRCSHDAANQLLTKECNRAFLDHAWWQDLKLVKISEPEKSARAEGVYQAVDIEVEYNERGVWASLKENRNTGYFNAVVVRENENTPWRIQSMGEC